MNQVRCGAGIRVPLRSIGPVMNSMGDYGCSPDSDAGDYSQAIYNLAITEITVSGIET